MKSLNPKFYILNSRNNGFTLIEVIVIIGIMALLSTMAILYSHTGEQQITLFQEQIRILNALSRAKSLSINTFTQPDVPCGFGVHFDASDNSFRIFRENATEIDCSNRDNIYTGASENFDATNANKEKYILNPAIAFDNLTVANIIFFPPNPDVIIMPNFQNEAVITLKLIDSGQPAAIKINNRGMISTQ